jgi:hypothetical protein
VGEVRDKKILDTHVFYWVDISPVTGELRMTNELRMPRLDSILELGEVAIKYKFQKNFEKAHKYFTDSNGMDLVERPVTRNDPWEAPSTQYEQSYPEQHDFLYPVSDAVYMRGAAELGIVVDRPAAARFRENEIHLFVSRKTKFDDWKGISEATDQKHDLLITQHLCLDQRDCRDFRKQTAQPPLVLRRKGLGKAKILAKYRPVAALPEENRVRLNFEVRNRKETRVTVYNQDFDKQITLKDFKKLVQKRLGR